MTAVVAANVDVIVNRRARHLGEGGKLHEVVLRAASRHGARVHETHDLGELASTVARMAARGTDAVVLAGGDGLHMEGLSALFRAFGDSLPLVGLAPGGTVCTVARNLGMKGAPGAWIEATIRSAASGKARTLRQETLRVRDDAGGDRVGFIFGAGLVAGFFDAYYAEPARVGLGRAAALASKIAAGALVGSRLSRDILSPVAGTLEVDDRTLPGTAWSLVLASVVRDVGLHIRATYRAGQEPGTFHVVASGLSPRALARELPRVLTGRPMGGERHVDALARSLRLRLNLSGAYVLDGDVMRAREIQVELGPAVRLVAG